MAKIKDYKWVDSCSECEFMGYFKAKDAENSGMVTMTNAEGDHTVFGCVLTPTPKDMTIDERYGVRMIENIWKRPKWCRLKKGLF